MNSHYNTPQNLLVPFFLAHVDTAVAVAFLRRWDRTIEYWNSGILTQSDLPADATPEERDFIDYVQFEDMYEQIEVTMNISILITY